MNGWLPTMVPGAPAPGPELRRRFGTKSMAELMAPAISYARDGFCIPVNVYKQWKAEVVRFTAAAKEDPAVFGPLVGVLHQKRPALRPRRALL